MDKQAQVWLVALIAGLLIWFYANSRLEIDYQRHPQLVDEKTGIKRRPADLLDLAKIINVTEDYVAHTNAEERLYDLAYLSNFENPFVLDQSYSRKEDLKRAAGPAFNQTQCGHQLTWLLQQLHQHPNYTLLRGRLGLELTSWMDSFGRPESGLYSGVTAWLGSYRQCESSRVGHIKTRYCLARLRLRWWPHKEIMYPVTSLKRALCLPESCDSRSLDAHRPQLEQLARLELPPHLRDNLQLHSLFCLPDERSELRQWPLGAHIFALVLGGWLALVLVASVLYEVCRRRRRRRLQVASFVAFENSPKLENHRQHLQVKSINQQQVDSPAESFLERLLEALALRHSLKLFKTNRFCVKYKHNHRVRVNLGGLDFFKVSMALLVVLGHAGFLAKIYARSLNNRLDLATGYAGRFALSVARCVDAFFLFFGVLTAYTLLRKFSHRQLANPLTWLLVNLGVFFRVAPLFTLVYWWARSVSPYLGSGPWWDYGVDQFSLKGVCMRDPWWKSLPHLGSLGTPPVPSCNLPAWFIVSYVQITLLMPTITYLICRLPTYAWKFAFATFLALISASSVATRLLMQTSVREEAFTLYGGLLSDLMEKFESTGHITTLGRVGIVALGCLVGYLLHEYEEGRIQDWPWWVKSRRVCLVSLASIITIIVAPMLGHKLHLLTGHMVSLQEFVLANFLITLLFPLLVSTLILYAATTCNHLVITRFFSHSFWHAFNRLGLAIFLVHWEVLFYGMTSYEHAPGYGFFTEVAKMWCFGAGTSILLAFFIHLLIEAPLSELVMIIMSSLVPTKSSTNDRQQDQKEDQQQEKVCPPTIIVIDTTKETTTVTAPSATQQQEFN